MKKTEVVFIPAPGLGHLVSTAEIAKLLIHRDQRLSVTVLIMKLPFDTGVTGYVQSLPPDATGRIRFVDLPHQDQDQDHESPSESKPTPTNPMLFLSAFVESQRSHVRKVVADITRSESGRLAGFVIDMFCTPMIDVANDFGVPTYVFFTSGAGFLGLNFYLQTLSDDHNQDLTGFKHSSSSDTTHLSVPSFVNPVPANVLPSGVLDKEGGSAIFISTARRFRETKGIMVNTFLELETHALNSFSSLLAPPIYPVGPVLNIKDDDDDGHSHRKADKKKITIMRWLDDQPPSSVVFLCFGSMGSFDGDQVKEIAEALEGSGHRFLWSLRRPTQREGTVGLPTEYDNPEEALPEGFVERTAGMGKVIGWAPQVAVLSHAAVGGFVSHCGWNSILESLWFGVPMATWPMYAEQQMNAFEMVKELGIAVEIKLEYRRDFFVIKKEEEEEEEDTVVLVKAAEIEAGIKRLMDPDPDPQLLLLRKKVKEMKEKSRMAMMEGGSSYASLGRLIQDLINGQPTIPFVSSNSIFSSP